MTAPTYFETLGLPQRFAVEPAELERRYLERSRALHPDFHGLASGAEQRVSLEQTAVLNEAYATLSKPLARAEYLLKLEGGPSAAERKEMAPAFLEEMLELRMEIEELRGQGRDSPGLARMEGQLVKRLDGLVEQVGQAFAKLEALPLGSPQRANVLVQVRQLLNTAKYIQGLIRDLRAD
jgi:molecular chaperone HscB